LGRGARIARRLGLGNRYLRFLKGVPKNGRVFEIGCGNGGFMRELINQGFTQVSGAELSDSYEPVVPKSLIAHGEGGDILRDMPEGWLAAIVAMDVFEHIPADNLAGLLRIAANRLAPDGRIVFRVPNMASPTAMFNYYGDLSHTTPLSEISVRQLVLGTGLRIEALYPEPFAYPRSLASAVGIMLWPLYKAMTRATLAAFGIRAKILTPSMVCVLTRTG
jgi:SAM-dependent methyltransferase